MSNVIEINNLYKEYRLGVIGRGTLYRDVQTLTAKILGKEDPNSIIGHYEKNEHAKERHLALKNINLSIKKGDILGIIGANGAGKSTLLKIISRITSPTKGEVKIRGRIASLLEVGTGFHSELTGRENIFLNGAINGMTKREVSEKLNQIVEFAGVEQYLDTPVKRYSSGMFVRLGFAIAAHIDPDILICDEVLAVGDADFQKKAINRMKKVSSEGQRTVIFVSHNMDSIRNLCTRVIVISKGVIIDDGPTALMVDKYLQNNNSILRDYKSLKWNFDEFGPGSKLVKLKSLSTKNNNDELCKDFSINEEINIEVEFWVNEEGCKFCCSLIFTYNNQHLFETFDDYIEGSWKDNNSLKKGLYLKKCKIPKNFFNEGVIGINLTIFMPPGSPDSTNQVNVFPRVNGALFFNVVDKHEKDSARGSYPHAWHKQTLVRPKLNWLSEKLE